MSISFVPVWKRAPFLRVLISFSAGILFHWYLQLELRYWAIMLIIAIFIFGLLSALSLLQRFRYGWMQGLSMNVTILSLGAILTCNSDIRKNKNWVGHTPFDLSAIVATLQEPLVEKPNSYKAIARINYLHDNIRSIPVTGNIIIYFQKDSSIQQLKYGSQIVFRKQLQQIKNTGNPGAFDYNRYCLFQGITHQLYLKTNEFVVLSETNKSLYKDFIFSTRQKVINILRRNIKGSKELGLAEALLIGYKDDLDKNLVQSYTNTGVVHIIAISGLHIGLIYGMLVLLLRPIRKMKWLRAIIIIALLFLFSLLAGAQASVMRSALMFTSLVLAETIDRRSYIINTMAVSAFFLLCYNPYWLWDVGFQLSYSAVLSIIIFFKPIYNWVYTENKILDFVWKLNAVTIAAQVLTVPVSLYHFHQFPNFFLLTNVVAVPLSSLILFAELFLCAVSFIPILSQWVGVFTAWLLRCMNSYVERINSLPFALWNNIQITIVQSILLLLLVWAVSAWLQYENKKAVLVGLLALAVFFSRRSYSFYNAAVQQKIIVYNVSKHSAIDFISGTHYTFIGDSMLLYDDFLQNFNLKPSRILHRLQSVEQVHHLKAYGQFIQFANMRILLIDSTIHFQNIEKKIPIDLLVISKNPKLYIKNLLQSFSIKQVVADASTPYWKRSYWKRDCDSLHIPFHDVSEEGAFVMRVEEQLAKK